MDGEMARRHEIGHAGMKTKGMVMVNLNQIGSGLQALEEVFMRLDEVLAPILVPLEEKDGPTAVGTIGARQSDAAETLEGYANRLERNVRRIHDILDRVDL